MRPRPQRLRWGDRWMLTTPSAASVSVAVYIQRGAHPLGHQEAAKEPGHGDAGPPGRVFQHCAGRYRGAGQAQGTALRRRGTALQGRRAHLLVASHSIAFEPGFSAGCQGREGQQEARPRRLWRQARQVRRPCTVQRAVRPKLLRVTYLRARRGRRQCRPRRPHRGAIHPILPLFCRFLPHDWSALDEAAMRRWRLLHFHPPRLPFARRGRRSGASRCGGGPVRTARTGPDGLQPEWTTAGGSPKRSVC